MEMMLIGILSIEIMWSRAVALRIETESHLRDAIERWI